MRFVHTFIIFILTKRLRIVRNSLHILAAVLLPAPLHYFPFESPTLISPTWLTSLHSALSSHTRGSYGRAKGITAKTTTKNLPLLCVWAVWCNRLKRNWLCHFDSAVIGGEQRRQQSFVPAFLCVHFCFARVFNRLRVDFIASRTSFHRHRCNFGMPAKWL